jgi:hypothetical protein
MFSMPPTDLEARVERLEGALRRSRQLAVVLAASLALVALGAWRAEDKVQTQTLVLTGASGLPAAVLRAGPPWDGASLILETPGGRQVMRLGAPSVRFAPW